MEIFTSIINVYAHIYPFAMLIAACYLIALYKKENKARNVRTVAYARYCNISVEEAKKSLHDFNKSR